jgi:hypothetical protein
VKRCAAVEELVLWHRVLASPRDGQDDAVALGRWTEAVAAAWTRAGGRSIALLGSNLVATFATEQLDAAIDASLAVLDDAERADPPVLAVIGAALGDVETSPVPRGSAVDRAALLSHRARAGELVLDPATAERAGAMYLFGRSVGVGADVAWRGQSIDRLCPQRAMCLPAARTLETFRLPTVLPAAIETLRKAVRDPAARWVVLRGGATAGTEEWVQALAREIAPPLVLWIQSVPGALEPLGSLRLALLRRWGSPAAVFEALGGTAAAATLSKIASGDAVSRNEAIRGVQGLLATFGGGGTRTWLVLNPFTSIDPATREVVAIASVRAQAPALVIANVSANVSLPKGLEPFVALDTPLPQLARGEAISIANLLLGGRASVDIVTRVATIGGASPLGVIEAARTLVARGDLITSEGQFVWRRRVPPFTGEVAVTSLISDRLAGLSHVERKILEVVAVAPGGSANELLWSVLRRDGIDGAQAFDAIARLRQAVFLTEDEPLSAVSSSLRGVVFDAIPSGRLMDLQRMLAEEDIVRTKNAAFASGTQGFFLYEAGEKIAAAQALLVAALAASQHGFPRAAMRLAAAAMEYDPSRGVRAQAAEVTEVSTATALPAEATETKAATINAGVSSASEAAANPVSSNEPSPSEPPPSARIDESQLSGAHTMPPKGDLRSQVVRAILNRNFEGADHTIDTLIAEGANAASAERLRAMAHLMRGDVHSASMLLARSKEAASAQSPSDSDVLRSEIAGAMVRLARGQSEDALFAALKAIGAARALGDGAGERAAMHTFAACLGALGDSQGAATVRLAAKP